MEKNPDPGSDVFLTPGSGIWIQDPGWEKIQFPVSKMFIPDLIFEKLSITVFF